LILPLQPDLHPPRLPSVSSSLGVDTVGLLSRIIMAALIIVSTPFSIIYLLLNI
jgi:hypothetical protein